MHWMAWIASPAIGALIGYVTNSIAVAMLFRPHQPRRLLGGAFLLHGLIPKRQPDLARKIGEVVGRHLVAHDDVVAAVGRMDLRPVIEKLIDGAMEAKLGELSALPMIGAFLTPERLSGIRDGIVNAVLEQEEHLISHLERGIEENLDISRIVTDKVASFPTEQMEAIILEVARRELRAIEIWGAVLGAIIGLGQVTLLHFLS